MRNLLKSDFYKLSKSKAFLNCLLGSAVLALIFVAALAAGVTHADSVVGTGAVESLATVLFTGFSLYIIAVFVPMFVSSEFQNGTIKNSISRGAGRTQVYLSKFITASCANIAMLLTFSLSFLAVGSILWGFDPNGVASFSSIATMMSTQALMVIAYTALFTFISMTLRGTVASVATNVACLAIVTVALGAISSLFSGGFSLADYWIGWGVSNLSTLTPATGDIIQGILIALGWGSASLLVGTSAFKRADIK